MVSYIVKAIFLVFWIVSVAFSVHFFNLTVKTLTTLDQIWGFVALYSFIIIGSTVVSFAVLFSSKKQE
ncbi:MAG: hypothetical protein K6357_04645 [Elusimicrobiota bacterium]